MDASSPGIGLPRPSLRAALGPGAALLAVLGLAAGDFGELAGPQRQAFAAVERNSRRLLALIDDLLALSRIESGTFVLELRPVALDALVERGRQGPAAPAGAP